MRSTIMSVPSYWNAQQGRFDLCAAGPMIYRCFPSQFKGPRQYRPPIPKTIEVTRWVGTTREKQYEGTVQCEGTVQYEGTVEKDTLRGCLWRHETLLPAHYVSCPQQGSRATYTTARELSSPTKAA
jgi:hypothetical protein